MARSVVAGTNVSLDLVSVPGSVVINAEGGEGTSVFTPEVTDAVELPVADVLAKQIDFRATGATLTNDAADQAKVETLKDNIIPGQVIKGTRGGGAVAAIKLADTLEFRRQPHLDLDPGFDIRLDKNGGSTNAVEVNVDYTRAEFDVDGSPSSAGDYRGTLLRGGQITINGTTAGYALALNVAGSGHKNGVLTKIEDMALAAPDDANLGGLLIDSSRTSVSVANIETQWLVVARCDIDGGITMKGEDGTVIQNSLSHGKRGLKISKTFGAFNWGVFGGAIVNEDFNVHIEDGSHGQFVNVQMERGGGAGTTDYMVWVQGLTYHAQGNSFRSCNFGGAVGLQDGMRLDRARRTLIDGCQWGNFENADLVLKVGDTGDAVANDCAGTILLPNQTFRGARSMRGISTTAVKTDLTRRMAIKTTSNRKFRQQHYNIWFPGFEQLTTAAGGPGAGVIDGPVVPLEFFMDEHGIVWSSGGIKKPTSSGGLTAGTVLGRLPFWMWPRFDRYITVSTKTRVGKAWCIVARNSDGTEDTSNANRGLLELQNDFSTEEDLYFDPWPAVLEPDYVTVS